MNEDISNVGLEGENILIFTLKLCNSPNTKDLIDDAVALKNGLIALALILDSNSTVLRGDAVKFLNDKLELEKYIGGQSHYKDSVLAARSIMIGLYRNGFMDRIFDSRGKFADNPVTKSYVLTKKGFETLKNLVTDLPASYQKSICATLSQFESSQQKNDTEIYSIIEANAGIIEKLTNEYDDALKMMEECLNNVKYYEDLSKEIEANMTSIKNKIQSIIAGKKHE